MTTLHRIIISAAAIVMSLTAYSSNWRKTTPTPHLTWQTRVLDRNVMVSNLPQVSEGIFYLQEYNRAIGYSAYFGFWTVDGRRLFPAQYLQMMEKPRFDSGACVVKSADSRNPYPIILYADGRQKNLSKEWAEMSQFYDGVAIVRETVNYRSHNLFYVNTKGEKVWPHLAETDTKGSIVIKMRHLRSGMRAYYSNRDRLWGFLDEKGNVVIKPAFADVRDFEGDYALVCLPQAPNDFSPGHPVFIDKKGATVVTVPYEASSLMYATGIGNLVDGYFTITDSDGTTYYDIQGNAVRHFAGGGSTFSDGLAFVRMEKYSDSAPAFVVNSSFEVVGRWPFIPTEFYNSIPTFTDSPYYTYNECVTVNQTGQPVMYVPKNVFSSNYLGQFSSDGYAAAKSVFTDAGSGRELTYTGYVDLTGRYVVAFNADNEAFDGGILPGPQPIEPQPIEPSDSTELPPFDTIAIGPTDVAQPLYEVKVVASPREGGEVYGSGRYSYGDTVRVTGTPAKGYRLSDISCDRQSSVTGTFNKFAVHGDMVITCYFVKDEVVTDVPTGCYSGKHILPSDDGEGLVSDLYLQIGNNEGNEYGDGSQGFLALMFDPRVHSAQNDVAGASVNVFFMPMNVRGQIEEGTRRWLLVDGGIIRYANLALTDESATGVFNNPMISMMLAFDGADSGGLAPGRYRIDITGSDFNKGIVHLGDMQRFSSQHGWVAAGSDIFERNLRGFFIKRKERGLNAEFFSGTTLTECPRRTDISFYPPEGFYANDSNGSRLKSFIRELGEHYRNLQSTDRRFSDYDLQQFSTDLDRNLFHPSL